MLGRSALFVLPSAWAFLGPLCSCRRGFFLLHVLALLSPPCPAFPRFSFHHLFSCEHRACQSQFGGNKRFDMFRPTLDANDLPRKFLLKLFGVYAGVEKEE